jgi:PPOX class probable F420-dependent enzyme
VSRSYELAGEHLEFWREKHHCAVTSLKADGSPHVVPMGIVVDPASGQAFGITSGRSQKVANLRRDPRIAVCQVDRGRWSTVEGTAEVLDDPESVADAVRRYAERYRQPKENPERVAVRITIVRVIGNV